MWAASDIAEWWDQQHNAADKELERFVDDNPNLFCVIVATAVSTAMQVGAGTVDVLRFGEGMAEGGLKGFGKDALRALSIAGTLGKGAKLAQSFAGARAARLIKDAPGPICGWVSITKALRQSGYKMYMAVSDLLGEDAMAPEIPTLAGSSMVQRVAKLRELGAEVVDTLKVPGKVDELRSMVPRDGSVVMFGVRWERLGKNELGLPETKNVAHALYAFYDYMGRFRIADRSGLVVSSLRELEELKPGYGAIGSAVPQSVALLKNVFMKFVGPKGLATLAMEVQAVMHSDPETVAQAFEVRKQAVLSSPNSGGPGQATATRRHHAVIAGDTLSKLAKALYGKWWKWPVIYEANRKIIGHNPNLIRVGQRLWIPELPKVSVGKGAIHAS
jgi:LysM domain